MICAQLLSCDQLFAAPWTIACQAPLSMEFSRQEYWRGLPFPSPRDLPNPHILHLLHWQADSLPPRHLGSFKKSELYKNAGDLDVSSSKFSGKSEARGLPDRPKAGRLSGKAHFPQRVLASSFPLELQTQPRAWILCGGSCLQIGVSIKPYGKQKEVNE